MSDLSDLSMEAIEHAERWYKDQPYHEVVVHLIAEVKRRRAESARAERVMAVLLKPIFLRDLAVSAGALSEWSDLKQASPADAMRLREISDFLRVLAAALEAHDGE